VTGLAGAVLLLLSVLGLVRPADAASTVQLPKGEQIQQMEWTPSGQLLLLTRTPSGMALRLGDPKDGSVSVVRASKSFSLINVESDFLLSPASNGVAAIEPADSVIEPSHLWLYRYEHGALSEVNLRKVDREFFPGHMTWNSDGSELFVSAAEYMGADQPDSVVAINAATGAVSSIVQKATADLVDDMVYAARTDALLVKCGGFKGSYPAEPIVVMLRLGSTEPIVLHTEASEFRLDALPDGSVLFSAPPSARERWVLLPGSSALRKSEEALQIEGWTSTVDGTWLGGIADGKSLKRPGREKYGVFRSRDGKRGFATAKPSRLVRFAPDAKFVASVSADGATVSVIPIPDSPSE
jgi:hypothetical protein